VSTLAPPPPRPLAAAAVDAENPWPGLESFREGDAGFFHGRSAESEALLRLVLRERLGVLFGLSGLGKSSLLQAGLFPKLRTQLHLPVYVRLVHDDDASPLRRQVLDALAAQARAYEVEAPEPLPGDTLWEYFHRRGHGCWNVENRPVLPLLAFDQFEEVFTLGRETAARTLRTAEFLDELGDLIEGRASASLKARLNTGQADPRDYVFNRHPYRVLLGIREDFLADLEAMAERVPSLMTNRMRLTALGGGAALRVTRVGGLVPEGGAVDVGERIVRLVAGEPGENAALPVGGITVEPALLSLFCRELNERRKENRSHFITADLVEGSRDGILSDYYARYTDDLGPEVRRFVEEHLLTVGGHRNSEALENALAAPGITREVVNELIARRLVRREDRDRSSRLELTHDVLTGVVRQSRDRRRAEEEASHEAERLRLEAERRAQEMERDAGQRRREVELARRGTRIALVAAVVCLLLAGYAVFAAKTARDARNLIQATSDSLIARTVSLRTATDSLRTSLLRESGAKKRSDSLATAALALAARADTAEEKATLARDSAQQALVSLQRTTGSLLATQDSVLDERLRSTVQAEAADHYLRITGQLHARQVARDASGLLTFQQSLARLEAERAQTQAKLDSLRAASNQRAAVFEDVLCGRAAAGDKTGVAAVLDTAVMNALRTRVRQQLAQRNEEFTCRTAPRASARSRAP
jgi:hypothetical protein